MQMLTKKEFEDIVLTVFKKKDTTFENVTTFDDIFKNENGEDDENGISVKETLLEIYEEISKLEETKIIKELNEQE